MPLERFLLHSASLRLPRPRRDALAAVSLVAVAALALTGCSSGSGGSAAEGEAGTLRVVTTTTQLTDFAAQIGGDEVNLTGLLTAGASAHHFDPSPADLLELGRADVLIVNGVDLETFIDSAVESSGFDGTIIVAAEGIDLHEAEEITAEGLSGDHDHAAESAETTDTAEPAEESHEGHDHGDINPHLWTSPQYAADMVNQIAEDLAAADPERAELFTENAAVYTERLHALDEWIAAQFARVPEADRVLVSGHDSLRYYLHDYDIAFAGSILPSFEDNAEPSAAQIDELVASIKENGVKAVFVESSMSPKLAQTIAQEAGVTVVDEESLYADSLGAPGSGAETYIDATIHNTRVILEAWGVTPDELPSELQ